MYVVCSQVKNRELRFDKVSSKTCKIISQEGVNAFDLNLEVSSNCPSISRSSIIFKNDIKLLTVDQQMVPLSIRQVTNERPT